MSLPQRPVTRGEAPGISGSHIRSLREQRAGHLQITAPGCSDERRSIFGVPQIDVRPAVEEHMEYVGMARHGYIYQHGLTRVSPSFGKHIPGELRPERVDLYHPQVSFRPKL